MMTSYVMFFGQSVMQLNMYGLWTFFIWSCRLDYCNVLLYGIAIEVSEFQRLGMGMKSWEWERMVYQNLFPHIYHYGRVWYIKTYSHSLPFPRFHSHSHSLELRDFNFIPIYSRKAILIPMVHSTSLPFPKGIPWDSSSSHSHAHLYSAIKHRSSSHCNDC